MPENLSCSIQAEGTRGLCSTPTDSRSPGPGKAEHSLRRGEAPYLCWIGHGLRFCSRIHCGEERDPIRLHCTLLPSLLSPKLAHPSFFPRERVCSPCSFPAASSPSGAMTPQNLARSQVSFPENNGQMSRVQALPPGWERDLEPRGREVTITDCTQLLQAGQGTFLGMVSINPHNNPSRHPFPFLTEEKMENEGSGGQGG